MPEQHAIELPADPSLGATVRIWVGESGRTLGLGESVVQDLRLVASELLANGVATGSERLGLELTGSDGTWELVARGVGPLGDGALGGLPISRLDLLRGLGTVRIDPDGVVRCSGSSD
ncbi:MAG TPA: hypothetical protein VE032_07330 [Actinomycetota bacterium]|nr:hypothetical protein [Actinomycetota bacterium]